MKDLNDFASRRTAKGFIAKAILKVCHPDEQVEEKRTLNKTNFSCRDVLHFHEILNRAKVA
jgi:hypothetical protein